MAENSDNFKLIVSLEARIRSYEKNLERAQKQTTQRMAGIERALKGPRAEFDRTGAMATRVLKDMETRSRRSALAISASFRALGAGLATAFSLGEAKQLIDMATRIENALKVAGLAGEELTRVYDALFQSAQRNAAPIESLVELYSRAALVQKELGVSTEELLGFTDKVAVALRVSGKSAQEASGALLQLSQALGSGVVRAEEFNSILEGALPIAQAAAAGLEEAGGSVAKLRQLVVEGKVSSEAFFRAFEAGASILETKVAGAELTVSQQFTRLQNVMIDTAGKLDDATDASGKTGRAVERLARGVEVLGDVLIRIANGPIGAFITKLGELDAKARAVFGFLAQFSFNDEIVSALNDFLAPSTPPAEGRDALRERLQALRKEKDSLTSVAKDLGFTNKEVDAEIRALEDKLAASYFDRSGPTRRGGKRRPVAKETVSLSDYAPPAPKISSAGDGGSAASTRERADEYERLAARIADGTASLVAETEAQRQLGTILNDYGFAIEKARAEHELLTAAQEAGKTVTPALRQEIAALADQYALATVEAAKLAEAQQVAADDIMFRKDLLKGALGNLRQALSDGKLEWEELGDIALRVLDKIIDRIENQLIDALFRASTFSGDSLFGSLFGGGGGNSAGVLGAIQSAAGGLYHGGGQAGSPSRTKHVPMSTFAGAPRFHDGLGPRELPAILEKGEHVLTRMQAKSAAGTISGLASMMSRGGGGGGVVELRLSKDLEARILKQSLDQSVTVTSNGLRQYDSQMPARVRGIQADGRAS